MPTHPNSSPTDAKHLRGVADLPLILEELQDQLDDLRAVIKTQQTQIDRQAVRINTLERR